jgi:hypothetical protein
MARQAPKRGGRPNQQKRGRREAQPTPAPNATSAGGADGGAVDGSAAGADDGAGDNADGQAQPEAPIGVEVAQVAAPPKSKARPGKAIPIPPTQASKGLLTSVETMAIMALGEDAAMLPEEREMIEGPLGRWFGRMGVERMGVVGEYADPAFVAMGFGRYGWRLMRQRQEAARQQLAELEHLPASAKAAESMPRDASAASAFGGFDMAGILNGRQS